MYNKEDYFIGCLFKGYMGWGWCKVEDVFMFSWGKLDIDR